MGGCSLYILFNIYLSRGGGVESQEVAERGRLPLMLHSNYHMGAFSFMFRKFLYCKKLKGLFFSLYCFIYFFLFFFLFFSPRPESVQIMHVCDHALQ